MEISGFDTAPVIRPVEPGNEWTALRDLRQRVLYSHLPAARTVYPGDDNPANLHLGAFTPDGTLIGICSLFALDDGSYQLRGMAVDPQARGQGVGALLVEEAQRIAYRERRPLWCNARQVAVAFYERMGWRKEGERFDITGIGPHYVMKAPDLSSQEAS